MVIMLIKNKDYAFLIVQIKIINMGIFKVKHVLLCVLQNIMEVILIINVLINVLKVIQTKL